MCTQLAWIAEHSEYSADIPLPAVMYLSYDELQRVYYGLQYDRVLKKQDNFQGIEAAYNHEAQVMMLDKDRDYTKRANRYVLLHELIHHVQAVSGKFPTYQCANESEEEAYWLTNLYVAETRAGKFKDAFSIWAFSSCTFGY